MSVIFVSLSLSLVEATESPQGWNVSLCVCARALACMCVRVLTLICIFSAPAYIEKAYQVFMCLILVVRGRSIGEPTGSLLGLHSYLTTFCFFYAGLHNLVGTRAK